MHERAPLTPSPLRVELTPAALNFASAVGQILTQQWINQQLSAGHPHLAQQLQNHTTDHQSSADATYRSN